MSNESAADPGVPAPPPGYSTPAPTAYSTSPGYGRPGYAPSPPETPVFYASGAYGPVAAPAKPPVKAWDVAVTIILLVVDLGLAAAASVMGMFLIMASDPCGVRACSNELIVLGWLIGMILPWVVLAVTVVWSIVRLVRRRLALWVPIVGAALIVLSLVLAFMVTAAGVPSS